MKTIVIIPAYNEEEAILYTVNDLKAKHQNVDVLVVNDCSTDNTKNILIHNNISFLDLPINLGIGGGVQAGYIYAYENGYDCAIQMDGDGQHPASELDKIMKPILNGNADIVIGSRFMDNVGFQSSMMRRIGIRFLSGLIVLCTGKRVYDVTSGYRAVNSKIIKLFSEEYAQDYPEPEAIVTALRHGAHIEEVPIIMKERQGGSSSISSLKSIYYMIKVSLAIIIRSMAK